MKKRSEARINKSLLVDISRRGFQQMGVTVNISRRGMFIATTEAFRKRSRLQILIAAADQIYTLSGMVVWKMKRDRHHRAGCARRPGHPHRDREPGLQPLCRRHPEKFRLRSPGHPAC